MSEYNTSNVPLSTQMLHNEVTMSDHAAPTFKDDSGLNSITDSPLISNAELSSPSGQDDQKSPLHIDILREGHSEHGGYPPLTAGLETGGLGQKYFEESAHLAFGLHESYYGPMNPNDPYFDDQYIHRDEEYHAFEENVLGATPQDPPEDELQPYLDPNKITRDLIELSKRPPPTVPTSTPSTNSPDQTSNASFDTIHYEPLSKLGDADISSITALDSAAHPDDLLSSSHDSQNATQSKHKDTIAVHRGAMPPQHQLLDNTAQFYMQGNPFAEQSGIILPTGDTNVTGFGTTAQHHISRQSSKHPQRPSPSRESSAPQQRPPTTMPSISRQQQHQEGRGRPMRFHSQNAVPRDRRQGGYHGGHQNLTTNPGYEQEEQMSYNYGFQGHHHAAASVVDGHFSQTQTQLAGHDGQFPRTWRQGEQTSHHSNLLVQQQHENEASQQDALYGSTIEILPAQFRSPEILQTDTMIQPPTSVTEEDTMFQSMAHAKTWRQRHLVSSGKTDPTIPNTLHEQKRAVKRLFDAINSTEVAMPSIYVRYFREQKYSAAFIESVCWVLLDACITRHTHGPLQTEDERAPFKAKTADFSTCGERIDHLVDALRTQKAICKKLMEPYHLFQIVDDPIGRIKRTENNKALNDRKAKQIAAGKAVGCDEKGSRASKRKRQAEDEEEYEYSNDEIEELFTGSGSGPQGLHPTSTGPVVVPSQLQPSQAMASRKRKFKAESAVDSSVSPEAWGSVASKRPRVMATSPPKASTTRRRPNQATNQTQPSNFNPNQSQIAVPEMQYWQPPSGRFQTSRQASTSAYGNPSTGVIEGAPYFTPRPNVQRRPGEPYPEIEGYHTPSSEIGAELPFDLGRTLGLNRPHAQQPNTTLHRGRAATDTAVPSTFSSALGYASNNLNSTGFNPSHKRGKREAEADDEGTESEFSLQKPKRARRKT